MDYPLFCSWGHKAGEDEITWSLTDQWTVAAQRCERESMAVAARWLACPAPGHKQQRSRNRRDFGENSSSPPGPPHSQAAKSCRSPSLQTLQNYKNPSSPTALPLQINRYSGVTLRFLFLSYKTKMMRNSIPCSSQWQNIPIAYHQLPFLSSCAYTSQCCR